MMERRNFIIYIFLRISVWLALLCAISGLLLQESGLVADSTAIGGFLLKSAAVLILAGPGITAVLSVIFGVSRQRRLAGLGLLLSLTASVSLNYLIH